MLLSDIVLSDSDPENEFQLLEQLGKGNYGKVYKALHYKTGNIVAVKVINISLDSNHDSLKKEINILSQCKCPFIV